MRCIYFIAELLSKVRDDNWIFQEASSALQRIRYVRMSNCRLPWSENETKKAGSVRKEVSWSLKYWDRTDGRTDGQTDERNSVASAYESLVEKATVAGLRARAPAPFHRCPDSRGEGSVRQLDKRREGTATGGARREETSWQKAVSAETFARLPLRCSCVLRVERWAFCWIFVFFFFKVFFCFQLCGAFDDGGDIFFCLTSQ